MQPTHIPLGHQRLKCFRAAGPSVEVNGGQSPAHASGEPRALRTQFRTTNVDSTSPDPSACHPTLTKRRIKIIGSFQQMQKKQWTKFNIHLRQKLSTK